MNRGLLVMGALVFLVGGFLKVKSYFADWEFQGWADELAPGLREKLNLFRVMWGKPVRVSSHPEAVGRVRDETDASQHNFNKWGEVRAVDIFPDGIKTKEDAERAIAIAVKCGFTGIGIYLDTDGGVMLHVDVRPGDYVAKWARVNGEYIDINIGLELLPA